MHFESSKTYFFSSILTSLLLVTLSIHVGKAQTLQASAKTDSSEILIGNPLTYTFSLSLEESAKFEPFASAENKIGKWEILAIMPPSIESKSYRQSLQLTCWDSGQIEIPAIPIHFKSQSNSIQSDSIQTAYTSPVFVQVNTVAVDTTKAFKEIKAPLSTSFMWQETIPYFVIGISLVIMTILSFLWWKKRKISSINVQKQANIPALKEIAMERLLNLEKSKLWQSGEIKMYYTRLSDILRVYIEKRYQILASDSTTSETLKAISSELNQEKLEKLKYVLELSDSVKFAKYQAMPSESAKVMEIAKLLIKEA